MQPVYNSFLIKVVDKGMHIKAHLDIFSKSQVKQIIKVMLLESQEISVLGPDVYLLFDINVSNWQHAYMKPFIFKISSENVLQLVIKKNGEREQSYRRQLLFVLGNGVIIKEICILSKFLIRYITQKSQHLMVYKSLSLEDLGGGGEWLHKSLLFLIIR